MRKSPLLLLLSALSLLFISYAGAQSPSLIANGGAENTDISNFPGWTRITTDHYSGLAAFEKTGAATLTGRDAVPVSTDKIYSVSLALKSAGTGGLSKVYAGLVSIDKDGNSISLSNYFHSADTETTLASELKTGDTVVHLSSSAGWSISSTSARYLAVFDDPFYAAYGPYYYSRKVAEVSSVDTDGNTVTLSAPWGLATVPAGARTANTSSGSTYLYTALSNGDVPRTWQKYEGFIQGVNPSDSQSASRFRPGTVAVKPVVLANYSQTTAYSLRMDDFNLHEVSSTDAFSLKSSSASLLLLKSGVLMSLRDTVTGTELLSSARPLSSLEIVDSPASAPRTVAASGVESLGSDLYRFSYSGVSTQVVMKILPVSRHISFVIDSVLNPVAGLQSITIAEIVSYHPAQSPAEKEWAEAASPDTPFMHLLPKTLETSCNVESSAPYNCAVDRRLYPAGRSPFIGAGSLLLVAPKKDYFTSLATMTQEEGLPYVEYDGSYFRLPPYRRSSYFFFQASDNPSAANYYEKLLTLTKRGGFRQVLLIDPLIPGEYNKPRSFASLDSFVSAMQKFRDAGIKIGIHTFLGHVDPGSAFFAPRTGLLKTQMGVLQQPLASSGSAVVLDSDILTNPVLTAYQAQVGSYYWPDTFVLIGDELIRCTGISGSQMSGCSRGSSGTIAAAHSINDPVYLVPRYVGFYLNPEAPEVLAASARSFAETASRLNVNFVFSDGKAMLSPPGMAGRIAGSYRFAYGVQPYQKAMGSAPFAVEYGDGPGGAGYAFYTDVKCTTSDGVVFKNKALSRDRKAAIISKRSPYADLLYEMGWFKVHGAELGKGNYDFEAATEDDFHYAFSKAIAYQTGVGLETGTFWERNSNIGGLFDLIHAYNNLSQQILSGLALPAGLTAYLTEPANEAELSTVDGINFIRKRVYDNYMELSNGSWQTQLENPFGAQKLKFELRAGFDYLPLNSTSHLNLANFGGSGIAATAETSSTTCTLSGGTLSVTNTGTGVGTCTIKLPGSFNLAFRRGLMLEMTSDGQESLAVVSLSNDGFGTRDFKINPESGRKVYLLTDPTTEVQDYVFTDSKGRKIFTPTSGMKRSWQFNYGSPCAAEITVSVKPGSHTMTFHTLKALQEKSDHNPLVNPGITVNGKSIVFPVTLYTDDTRAHILRYNGYKKQYSLYDSNFTLLKQGVLVNDPLVIPSGTSDVVIGADTSQAAYSTRARLQLSVYDDEDGDGIPSHGSFEAGYTPKSSSRINFYDDNTPSLRDILPPAVPMGLRAAQ